MVVHNRKLTKFVPRSVIANKTCPASNHFLSFCLNWHGRVNFLVFLASAARFSMMVGVLSRLGRIIDLKVPIFSTNGKKETCGRTSADWSPQPMEQMLGPVSGHNCSNVLQAAENKIAAINVLSRLLFLCLRDKRSPRRVSLILFFSLHIPFHLLVSSVCWIQMPSLQWGVFLFSTP